MFLSQEKKVKKKKTLQEQTEWMENANTWNNG